ncbi:MAG: ABC transporter permease [Proteobacteria bacterium]|nr:ABC transporter permease [Pseudomonadota bacterium]
MTNAANAIAGLETADGTPLKAALARALRRKRMRAVLLVMPLFIFVFLTFLYPIGLMLFRSIDNPLVSEHMPRTVAALKDWTADDLPGEAAFAALTQDLEDARKSGAAGRLATNLNYQTGGLRSTITRTARQAGKLEAPFKEKLIEISPAWGNIETWATIKLLSDRFSMVQYAAALDRKYDIHQNVVPLPEDQQIYVTLFMRTLWMSIVVTVSCLLLGFPIAYMLASLPLKHSNLLMILVLLPFWTSLLVRTTSWIVLLQTQGVLNDLMVFFHIINDAGRVQLIFNATGTVIAMTQILLPFMVLPLYSVMKTISPTYMRAAQSLGAHRFLAYGRVYLPQTLPGIGAGCLLVFILAIGYYITPALVGGQDGQMISNMIAFHMQKSLNWGLAAALGGILLVGVIILYWVYNKIVGVERLKLG